MALKIKSFMDFVQVGTKGIEFEVRSTDNKTQIGDLILSKAKMIWCPGRTTAANGVTVKWTELAELLKSKASFKAALKAARTVNNS